MAVNPPRATSPWHPVQVPFAPLPAARSTTPFTCKPPETLTVPSGLTVPAWHTAQLVTPPEVDGWGAAGGRPWQVPQAACVPSTRFQTGETSAPPWSVAPWQ